MAQDLYSEPRTADDDAPTRVVPSHVRVLIAEDNAVNMQVASFHLEDLGLTSSPAVNGAIALALYEKDPFDFVLMDCQMPVMDGFQALAAIRTFETAHQIPRATIIAVTAADDAGSQMQCAAAGFDGFLAKPFTASQLESVLLDCRSSLRHLSVPHDAQHDDADTTQLPVLDRSAFHAFVDEFGVDTAAALLASFVKSLQECKTKFDTAVAAKDTPALQALAHKITGAAGTVGAVAAARSARSIEATCKRGEFRWSSDIADFGVTLIATIAAFQPLQTPGALQFALKCFPGKV